MKTTKSKYFADLNSIRELTKKRSSIVIERIPVTFRQDLIQFIVGDTLQKKEGKLVVGIKRYKEWVAKIMNKGLSYEIELIKEG